MLYSKMKSGFWIWLLVVVFSTSILMAATSTSSIFYENWENLSVGDSPALNDWTVAGVSQAVQNGNIGGPNGDDKILSVLTSASAYMNRSGSPLQVVPDANTITVEYDFRVDLIYPVSFFALNYSYGQGGWKREDYKLTGEGATYGNFLKLQAFETEPWDYNDVVMLEDKKDYHFVDVFTVGSSTHNLTITNQGTVVFQGDLTALATFDDGALTTMEFSTATNSSCEVLLDNILVVSGPRGCGDPTTVYLDADVNEDCYVDFLDFAQFAIDWMDCTDPNNNSCSGWYWD